ncbi:PH domain-containing protein [Mucilaginibacter robiniae]|uniref:PH domain-containing protein n=1 Tax=Mucilaginibacter robiniae TaxID=2728022 RepID=A0A7L5E0Z5_9SPHI|nr:PH domain-containing protein [Mucilaginibacter robiniae]QJD97032.1 PH domain-containing protein [Mucilaginibacter robiniae]
MSTIKTYPSKIDNWFIIVVLGTFTASLVSVFFKPDWIAVMIILSIVSLVLLPIVFNTNYRIKGQLLKVQSGIILNLSIDISTINRITATRSILSAPALSLDRLEVFYNKYDSVVISPRNKADFIAQLKQINPNISIDL